jgi:hypothetical protein
LFVDRRSKKGKEFSSHLKGVRIDGRTHTEPFEGCAHMDGYVREMKNVIENFCGEKNG